MGSKKDEFFLQRKRATKQEIQSLLEGAGFSKSNPYFMVQQGKIQSICLMTDLQRLQLLQSVAGTTVYEDKKAESLSKMQENLQSIDKINSILTDLEHKLEELRGEKEELTNYRTYDRQRKAMEYTLYDKELFKARRLLDSLEQERTNHVQQLTQLHEQAKETHDAIQNAEAILKVKSAALKRNRLSVEHLEADKTRAVTQRTKLTLECQELQELVTAGNESLQQAQQELVQLDQQIDQTKQALAQREQAWMEQSQRVVQLRQERDQAQRQMDSIYAKQGRGRQYQTKEQRDKVLKKQMKELDSLRVEKEQYLQQNQDALGNLRRLMASQEQELRTKQEEIDTKTASLQAINKVLDEKAKNKLAATEARKRLWRQAEELQDQTREAREALHKAISDTRKSMPRATAMGLKALSNIVEQERLVVGEQYFGMLLENMNLKDPKYQTAVDLAAQNSLFHVIVDTDATAARLMRRLEEGKLGRVTFLPLDRLRVDHTSYPQSPDVMPLLDVCIEYDPKVRKAMLHVFDKKLLARTSEVASEWASKVHMDCITLEGDLCSRKGALTGGYIDHNKSRILAFANQQQAQAQFDQVERNFRQVDHEAKDAEQDVTNASQEVSRLQHKQAQLVRLTDALKSQVEELQVQLESNKKQAHKLETQVLPPLQLEIDSAKVDMARLKDELGAELTTSLTDEDRANLAQLKQVQAQLVNNIQEQQDILEEMDAERQKLQSILDDNLLKRRQELMQVKDDVSGQATTSTLQEQRARELEERTQQLNEAAKVAEEIEERLEEARKVQENIKAELIAAKNELEKLKSQDAKTDNLLHEARERSEALMNKVCQLVCLYVA